MPGYSGAKSPVQAIASAYFYQVVFKRIKQMKFLVVLNEPQLLEPSGR
jgi:hypothetical protein